MHMWRHIWPLAEKARFKKYEVEFEIVVSVEVDECIFYVIKLFRLEFAVRAKTNTWLLNL